MILLKNLLLSFFMRTKKPMSEDIGFLLLTRVELNNVNNPRFFNGLKGFLENLPQNLPQLDIKCIFKCGN